MRQPLSLLGTRAGTALLLALVTFALPVAARAQVVHHDFEDGTTEGWVRRGTAILAVTNEAAATGLNSLKTTGRTAPWNGPGLDVMPTVQKDLLYQIRVSVRLTAGQAALQDTLRMTIERRVAGETSDRFDSIAASATSGVTSGSWVALQGRDPDRLRLPGEQRRVGKWCPQQCRDLERSHGRILPEHVPLRRSEAGAPEGSPSQQPGIRGRGEPVNAANWPIEPRWAGRQRRF